MDAAQDFLAKMEASKIVSAEELEVVRKGQEDFVYFLENVFPFSFEGQLFLRADDTHEPFSLGEFHRQLASTIQEELTSGGRSRFSFMAPRLHLKS
ncbi:hypothetical protein LCGC14_3055910, partial [marine sediment metagenome]